MQKTSVISFRLSNLHLWKFDSNANIKSTQLNSLYLYLYIKKELKKLKLYVLDYKIELNINQELTTFKFIYFKYKHKQQKRLKWWQRKDIAEKRWRERTERKRKEKELKRKNLMQGQKDLIDLFIHKAKLRSNSLSVKKDQTKILSHKKKHKTNFLLKHINPQKTKLDKNTKLRFVKSWLEFSKDKNSKHYLIHNRRVAYKQWKYLRKKIFLWFLKLSSKYSKLRKLKLELTNKFLTKTRIKKILLNCIFFKPATGPWKQIFKFLKKEFLKKSKKFATGDISKTKKVTIRKKRSKTYLKKKYLKLFKILFFNKTIKNWLKCKKKTNLIIPKNKKTNNYLFTKPQNRNFNYFKKQMLNRSLFFKRHVKSTKLLAKTKLKIWKKLQKHLKKIRFQKKLEQKIKKRFNHPIKINAQNIKTIMPRSWKNELKVLKLMSGRYFRKIRYAKELSLLVFMSFMFQKTDALSIFIAKHFRKQRFPKYFIQTIIRICDKLKTRPWFDALKISIWGKFTRSKKQRTVEVKHLWGRLDATNLNVPVFETLTHLRHKKGIYGMRLKIKSNYAFKKKTQIQIISKKKNN